MWIPFSIQSECVGELAVRIIVAPVVGIHVVVVVDDDRRFAFGDGGDVAGSVVVVVVVAVGAVVEFVVADTVVPLGVDGEDGLVDSAPVAAVDQGSVAAASSWRSSCDLAHYGDRAALDADADRDYVDADDRAMLPVLPD